MAGTDGRGVAATRWAALAAAVLVGALLVGACGDGSSGGDDGGDGGGDGAAVVATTTILADITSEVACGRLDVPSVIPVGADAHEFEPSVQDADRLLAAQLVVANGLGLEEGMQDALGAASDAGVEVLEVGPHASPREVDGAPDPHVWMDPDRMADAVGAIAEALEGVEGLPVPPDEVRTCAAAYQDELRALGDEMEATLSVVPPERRKLVTNHEALGYFADRFDFEVIGTVIPSTSSLGESNPRDLDELADAIRAAGVPAIFGETTQPTKVATALADRVGGDVRVEELATESLGEAGSPTATYVGMLRTDAATVASALAPTGAGSPAGS